MSDIASDLTPVFLEAHGFKSVPKSVAHGYTASGYGYVQDMPYAYIHEFTRTSMAGKIRRFKGGYTGVWQRISDSLPIEVRCNTEVLKVRRDSSCISIDVRDNTGEMEVLEFDKIIISGSIPFNSGKTYRSPSSITTGMLNHLNCSLYNICMKIKLYKKKKEKTRTFSYYFQVFSWFF